MPKRTRSSGEGEIAAVRGFTKQYEYSACVIYNAMQEGIFDAIYLANPEAGLLDDLLLESKGVLQATQIKTETNASSVALSSQLISSKLISEIVASWLSLEAGHGAGNVRANYIFGGYFSSSDYALANDGSEGPRHSAAFVDFINRDKLTREEISASRWSSKLEEMRELCGLTEEDFIRFLNCFRLCDRDEVARKRIEAYPPSERRRLLEIQSLLPRLIAEAHPGEKWTESELVQKLGWRSKLSQRNFHDFPVPDDFQDNITTQNEVIAAIKDYTSGYISLLGPPGSGKSTLLQRALFSNVDYGVARYLAFIPDQRHGLGRAEAGEFLNDLTSELSDLGFMSGSRFWNDTLSELRSELLRQLNEAGQRYSETGRKTVVIVDGLDHVPREETPNISFLKELPPAHSIPDGVLFVLGTQHLELEDLNATAKQQAGKPGRCIKVDPLPRAAIFEMAEAAGIPSFVSRAELYSATAGHPLTARYFIEALKSVPDAGIAERLMSFTDGLGHSLEQIYDRVWKALQPREDSKRVLALLARADGSVSAEQLALTVNDNAVEDVLSHAGFLLSRTEDGFLSIFHNSFRLFLATETNKRFGQSDLKTERDLYSVLADLAARSSKDDPQRWMELRYRARAGDGDGVLSIGTPDYFRASLAAYRPSTEIYIDLRLTYAAVKPTRDRSLLLNKLLIEKELEYRLEAVSQTDFVEVLLYLGERDLAIKHALGGSPGNGWLELVDVLWADGKQELSRKVFEANEPLEPFFSEHGFDINQHLADARHWIERAHRFRPIERLVAQIEALPMETRFGDAEDMGWVRTDLLFCLAQGVIGDNAETDILDLSARLELPDQDVQRLEIQAAQNGLDRGDLVSCRQALTRTLKHGNIDELDFAWRQSAAVLAFKAHQTDLAKEFLSTLVIPAIVRGRDTFSRDAFVADCKTYFTLVFLEKALGVELKRADQPMDSFFSSAQKRLEQLASIRGRIEAGENGPNVTDLRSVLLFFAHARPDRSHTDGYRFYAMLPWLGATIVDIAHRLGDEEFKEIVAIVDSKLGEDRNNFSESEAFRLKFATVVHRYDRKTEDAARRLRRIRDHFGVDRTPHEAVDTKIALTKAYAEVGLLNDAWQNLNSIHEDTFGYWLRAKKEPQYEFWAWAFLHACDAAPQNAGAYGREFGRFILGMDETEGDETARRVLSDLMKGSCHSSSVAAGLLARLIDSDLTTWAQLASATLASIVRLRPNLAQQCVHAFSHLVVPFYDGDTDGFVVAALTAIEEDQLEPVATSLVSAIQRWCPQSRRIGLLEQVMEGAPSRRAKLQPMIEKARGISAQLIRDSHDSSKDSVSIDIEATSLTSLLEAGEGKSDYGDGVDYSYARAAEKLVSKASKADIEALIGARPHLLNDAKFSVACSRSMLRAGETAFADELFLRAEKAARNGHWSWYLGGQKLDLQKLRIERDGDDAREHGFDLLIAELASGQTAGSSLFLNLDEILEQISIVVPHLEFWEETEAHLKQYREYRLAAPVSAISETQSHSDLLARLLVQGFSFSCPEILDHARAAVLAIAEDEGGASVLGALIPLLENQPDGIRETAALCYRLRRHAHLSDCVTKEARRLRNHEDFVVSNQAERILRGYGELEETQKAPQTLPSFYSLQPSGSSQANNFDLAPGTIPGSRAVWSDDPWTLTSGLRFPFRVLADASGIDIEMLRRRCAEFMRREGGREAFGPEAETRLVSRLQRLNLKFNYRRLTPMAAQRGLGMVVNELARAEHVDPRAFQAIWSELGGPPLAGFRFPVVARPEWIEPPQVPRRKHGGLEADAWLDTINESLCVPWAPDQFVLAEKSFFKTRIWREAVESNRYCLPAQLDVNINTDFSGIPKLFSVDDFQPLYGREKSPVVCRVEDFYYGDLRDSTLTLCPHILSDLGWARSPNEPLVIIDDKGTVAAQTVRWVDGTDELGFYESEAYGAGQALVLTLEALSSLEGLVGRLRIGARVIRKIVPETGEPTERTHIAS